MTKLPKNRPAQDEIEVTKEMIDAGLFELAQYDPGNDRGDLMVRRIFLAMVSARRQDHSGEDLQLAWVPDQTR